MSRYRRRRGGSDGTLSLVVWLMLIIFALPLVGLYFLLRDNPSQRPLGWILLIVGIILWIAVGVGA